MDHSNHGEKIVRLRQATQWARTFKLYNHSAKFVNSDVSYAYKQTSETPLLLQ